MAASKKKKKTAPKKAAPKKAAKQKQSKRPLLSATAVGAILAVLGVLLLILFIMISPFKTVSGAGVILQGIVKFFTLLFGTARFLFPFYLLLLAFAFLRKHSEGFGFVRVVVFSSILFFVFPAFFNMDQRFVDFGSYISKAAEGDGGGVIGGCLAYGLQRLFAVPISVAILLLLAILSVLMLANFSFKAFFAARKERFSERMAARKEERQRARLEDDEEGEEDLFTVLERDERDGWHSPEKEVRKSAASFSLKKPFSGREKEPPKPGERRRKVVEYGENDSVVIDGIVFTRDEDNSDFDGKTLREHITGRREIDDITITLSDDDLKPEPGEHIPVGLAGGYGGDDFEGEYFSVNRLDEEEENENDENAPVAVFEEIERDDGAEKKDGGEKDEEFTVEAEDPAKKAAMSHFSLPKTSILERPKKGNKHRNTQIIREGVKKLETALESFGVEARVVDVNVGPSLIRYEVQPGPGVKVSRIAGLSDDIALQLAASGVRIAPIPGKSVIGIEVPRVDNVTVYFREILENSAFFELPSKLTCAFGQDIDGEPVIGDLTDMPHLLIAGTTGSGKSVCMNTMICSILFKATPDQVKFIMIDPKQVEFVIYEGLPHLITPVVTDAKKAAGALKWALREMENRYTIFSQNRVRNIFGYNKIALEADRMPQIVVFIDELADLMMVAAKDVESSICRLAQKGRAAGIHLVIATQRPSVDVITGLIKANVPSRIALAVSSGTDSRTIIDNIGAEKLLGHGDMLYMPIGTSRPRRVQGAWLSDGDAAAILEHYKKQGEPEYIEGVAQAVDGDAKKEQSFGDPLFFDAARAAITAGQASTSMMQRRFRIGYNHAARIMEELEEKGIIGPAEGAKPRTVLMTLETFKETFREEEEGSLFDEDNNVF